MSSDEFSDFELYDQSQVLPSLPPQRDSEEENDPPAAKRPRGPDVEYTLWQRFKSLNDFTRYWEADVSNWRKKNSHATADAEVVTW